MEKEVFQVGPLRIEVSVEEEPQEEHCKCSHCKREDDTCPKLTEEQAEKLERTTLGTLSQVIEELFGHKVTPYSLLQEICDYHNIMNEVENEEEEGE